MRHIENIEIKNFKSIRHAKIQDCRRINFFVGYPNVGKSNILEALSLFAVFQGVPLKNLVRVKEDTTIFYNGFINNKIEILVNSFHRLMGEYKDEEFWLKYAYHSVDLGYREMISERYKNFDMKGSSRGTGDIPDFPFRVKRYEFSKNRSRNEQGYERLHIPYGDNIFSVLSANETLNNEVAELFKSYDLELLFDSRAQAFTILKRTKSGIFSIPYDLIADTLQRIIFYKAAIQSNKDAVLLFEEPEAHMFPPYIAKLTTDIMYDKQKNQYFISTHSPFVLNDFIEHSEKHDIGIYTVGYKKGSGETTINKLTEDEVNEIYQYGVDVFFNLNDYLKDSVS
jgi:AAA15 family ATPase/GTPase